MSSATMTKKRRGPKPKAETKDALIAVKCREEFKRWLEEFAESERSTPSQMVELGLVALAKERKYKAPPLR